MADSAVAERLVAVQVIIPDHKRPVFGLGNIICVLRDLFVNLPGIGDDKICTAYTRGGITLVYQALEDSLGLRPDGYLLFTYDGFRALIDRLCGAVWWGLPVRSAQGGRTA